MWALLSCPILRNNSSSGYAIVELDTIFLSQITQSISVGSWNKSDFNVSDWKYAFPEWTSNQLIEAVPHWYCSNFVYTRTDQGSNFPNFTSFADFLSSKNSIPVVDITGSYNVPGMYLQSFSQEFPGSSSLNSTTVNDHIISILNKLISTCQTTSGNPCYNGTFSDENTRYEYFLTQAQAYVGFSETITALLNYAQTKGYPIDINDLSVQILPLNVQGTNPSLATFYTDAFVLNPGCTGECFSAATQLIQYLTSTSTYSWMLNSQDSTQSGVLPRYLIPPVKSLDSLLASNHIFNPLSNLGYPIQTPYPFDFSINQNKYKKI
eukprot:TRINITY_DN4374_c0_g1_i2.p1 TRINITY_DN4374_c0_g1~~TRINITY_DN4374_c0_g1_i2.p1  ORF type:complete len:322 (-),score=27.08 TRINITY_DN4374_c0_g1_i2:163-1128(-)